MSDTINMLNAKSSLSKLVHALETGAATEFIIARNGRPAARLVALANPEGARQRRIGAAKGRFSVPADIDLLNSEVRRLMEGSA
jgi:antitoxin (DNA-binding transcriptional repressor) of toxin-antitoxin stability system